MKFVLKILLLICTGTIFSREPAEFVILEEVNFPEGPAWAMERIRQYSPEPIHTFSEVPTCADRSSDCDPCSPFQGANGCPADKFYCKC